jgi:hypothetical protein
VAERQLGVGKSDQGHGIPGKALEVITAATPQQGHSLDTVGLAIVGSTGVGRVPWN